VDEENFLTWRSPCLDSKTKIIEGHGIFCANFIMRDVSSGEGVQGGKTWLHYSVVVMVVGGGVVYYRG